MSHLLSDSPPSAQLAFLAPRRDSEPPGGAPGASDADSSGARGLLADAAPDAASALFLELAMPVPMAHPLHYRAPLALMDRIRPGQGVRAPFGRRTMVGFVLGVSPDPPPDVPLNKIREVLEIVHEQPLLPASLLPVLRFAARYYRHPIGEVVKTALPAGATEASRATLGLSARGRALLEGPVTLPPEGGLVSSREEVPESVWPLLEALRQRKLRPATAEARFTRAALREALRSGWVEIAQEVSRKAIRQRKVAWVALSRPREEVDRLFSRRGPVRDRMLAWLEHRGEVQRQEVVDQFKGAGRVLRQLAEKGALREWEVAELPPDPLAPPKNLEGVLPPTPTPQQQTVLNQLLPAVRSGQNHAFLLHGVTGSGKTEVYLRAAAEALAQGRSAIILVPEIGLTPQLLARFRARFGHRIGLLHSDLTDRERYDHWERLRLGAARVAVGARSALFAPVDNLGLIVVDEEHDSSYKQDDGLRYSARDLALMRARADSCTVILGSATPSIESFRRALDGKQLELLTMDMRANASPLPTVQVVDLTRRGREKARAARRSEEETESDQPQVAAEPADEKRPVSAFVEVGEVEQGIVEDEDGVKVPGSGLLLSRELLEALSETLERKEQAILLLNRRGLATYVTCTTCGGSFQCPHCDISLTYHGRSHQLLCHCCGYRLTHPDACPACQATTLARFGRGTERVEEILMERLPQARIDRMDRDTTRSRGSHARILERFRNRQIDILVGTQMVAKGHDFPAVTLVGVLHADAALHLPDFRAAERTFSLLTQVAGRAGRAERKGRVLLQTYHPWHYAVQTAVKQDYRSFYQRDLRFRRALGYPPFGRLALVKLSHPDLKKATDHARRVASAFRQALHPKERPGERQPTGLAQVVGPAPAALARMQGRYRWQILLKADGHRSLQSSLDRIEPILAEARKLKGIRLSLDVDPIRLM